MTGGNDPNTFKFKPKDPYGFDVAVTQHVKKSEAPTQQKKQKKTKVEDKSEKPKD